MKELEITAGIIVKNNKVLIGQRKFHDKFGGKWEFPGGKLENSEMPEDCIIRELKEELNINVIKFEHFISYVQDFSSYKMIIHAFLITEYAGDFQINDHEKIIWTNIEDLYSYDLLEADKEIVKKLQSLS